MSRTTHTRLVHQFDMALTTMARCHPSLRYAENYRTKSSLTRMARLVWAKHGRADMPNGPRITYHQKCITACYGRADIEIQYDHQSYSVLLHELVHAMGYDHGPGFVRKYIGVLVEYCNCVDSVLEERARNLGINI